MERKNMVLLTVIAVATLLVAVVGATFAYFTAATATDSRDEADGNKGQANIQAADIQSNITKTLNDVSGAAGHFNAENVLPGHKEVAALKLTVGTTNEQGAKVPVAFIYDVTTNEFEKDHIKIRVYRSTKDAEPVTIESNYFECATHTDPASSTHFFEKCNDEGKPEKTFGTQVGEEVKLAGGPQKIEIAIDTINLESQTEETYNYYVVVEYDNISDAQDTEQGKALEGTITVA